MSDSFDEEQVKKIAKYIQKKERRLAAINAGITGINNGVYQTELVEIANLVYEDKLPGGIDTQKFFPDLYPKSEKKKEDEKKED